MALLDINNKGRDRILSYYAINRATVSVGNHLKDVAEPINKTPPVHALVQTDVKFRDSDGFCSDIREL